MNARKGLPLILFGALFLIAAPLFVAWNCSSGLDSVRYGSNVLLERVCPAGRGLIFGRGWGWIVLSREAMIAGIGMVLIVWGAVSMAGSGRPKKHPRRARSAPAAPERGTSSTDVAANNRVDFDFVPSGSSVVDKAQGFAVVPSTGRIDDFFPSITFYDVRQELPRLLCTFKGRPGRHHPALRFVVAGYKSMREEIERVEQTCPTLAGRGAEFIVDGLRNLVQTRSFWISMQANTPGRTSVLIDRVEVVLPADLSADLPEHIRATFDPLEDGTFLIAEGPL